MRKNLPLLLLISLSFSIHGFGQGKRSLDNMISVPLPQIHLVELNNTCDSIGWPFSESAGFAVFQIGNNGGYLTGTNEYEDRAKANFIDLSSSNASFILRAIIGMGPVNSKSSGSDFTRQVFVRVYDGTTNTPGAVLGSYVATLEEMRARRLNFTFVVFPSAI
nr:hypothetical protein [Chitinophagaceae bacterium]